MKKLIFTTFLFFSLFALTACYRSNRQSFNVQILEMPWGYNSILARGYEGKFDGWNFSFNFANLREIGVSVGDVVTVETNTEWPLPDPVPIQVYMWSIYKNIETVTFEAQIIDSVDPDRILVRWLKDGYYSSFDTSQIHSFWGIGEVGDYVTITVHSGDWEDTDPWRLNPIHWVLHRE